MKHLPQEAELRNKLRQFKKDHTDEVDGYETLCEADIDVLMQLITEHANKAYERGIQDGHAAEYETQTRLSTPSEQPNRGDTK